MFSSIKYRFKKKIQSYENSVLILCYHRVGKNINDLWGNSVSVENFKDQMTHLSSNYNILSIEELYEQYIRGKILNHRNIIITFDDGYEINTNYALNILDSLKIPSTFYMNTYMLGTNRHFWWDELQLIFSKHNSLPAKLVINMYENEIVFPLNNNNNISFTMQTIHRFLKGQESSVRMKMLESISKQVHITDQTNDEITPVTERGILQTASNELFTIGGHTHSHNSISLLDEKSQSNEIRVNKNILEELISKKIKHFSYPFGGKTDYDKNTIKIINNFNYHTAVTTNKSPFRIKSNIYEIPRFSIKNWNDNDFSKKINSYFNF